MPMPMGVAMTMTRVALSARRRPQAPATAASLVAAEAEAANGWVGGRWRSGGAAAACGRSLSHQHAWQGEAGQRGGKGHGWADGGRDRSSCGRQAALVSPATTNDGDAEDTHLRWLAGGMKESTVAAIHPARRRAANPWLFIARGGRRGPMQPVQRDARPRSASSPAGGGDRRWSRCASDRPPGRSGQSWRSAAPRFWVVQCLESMTSALFGHLCFLTLCDRAPVPRRMRRRPGGRRSGRTLSERSDDEIVGTARSTRRSAATLNRISS